jgi:hypothetical protein
MISFAAALGICLALDDVRPMSTYSRALTVYQWAREAGVPLRLEDPANEWLYQHLARRPELTEEVQLLIDVIRKTPIDDEDRGLFLVTLYLSRAEELKRPYFQAAAESGVDGDWQLGSVYMYRLRDDSAVRWWKQKLVDPATSVRMKNGAVIYLTEADPVKYSDLILANRPQRQLVKGTGSGLVDSDRDGDSDNLDPWPNAAGSAETEEQKIMAAGFEMLCRQSEGSDMLPSELVLPQKMKAFEMPGRAAQTYWRPSRKACKSETALIWKGAKINRAKGTAEYEFQMVSEPTIAFGGTAHLVKGEWIAEGRWYMDGMCGTWAAGQSWVGRLQRGG